MLPGGSGARQRGGRRMQAGSEDGAVRIGQLGGRPRAPHSLNKSQTKTNSYKI